MLESAGVGTSDTRSPRVTRTGSFTLTIKPWPSALVNSCYNTTDQITMHHSLETVNLGKLAPYTLSVYIFFLNEELQWSLFKALLLVSYHFFTKHYSSKELNFYHFMLGTPLLPSQHVLCIFSSSVNKYVVHYQCIEMKKLSVFYGLMLIVRTNHM